MTEAPQGSAAISISGARNRHLLGTDVDSGSEANALIAIRCQTWSPICLSRLAPGQVVLHRLLVEPTPELVLRAAPLGGPPEQGKRTLLVSWSASPPR